MATVKKERQEKIKKAKNNPTPKPAPNKIANLGIEKPAITILDAKTCKSGSAIVDTIPKTKPNII